MYLPQHGEVSIIAICGVEDKVENLSINAIANYIGLERCNELLFLHSLTGSDYTSSFFKVEKCRFWDAWLENNEISKTFQALSYCPVLPLNERVSSNNRTVCDISI